MILKYILKREHPLRKINADKPSATTKITSAVVKGTDKIIRWEKCLSTAQITKIQRVVSEFGLDYLYGEEVTPLSNWSEIMG
jgi:hypothetical protein